MDDALWAYMIAYKTPLDMSQYKLVCGKTCHLPIELEYKIMQDMKQLNLDLGKSDRDKMSQMLKLEELRLEAYDRAQICTYKIKKWHDARIQKRQLKVREKVLLFYYRLKLFHGKLKSRWSGPCVITQDSPTRVVTLKNNSGEELKVDSQRFKHYLGDSPIVAHIASFIFK